MGEEVKDLKKRLLSIIQTQINGDISQVDAKELGEVVDMFKDFAEAEYYCSVTDAMEESSQDTKEHYMAKYAPETNTRYYTNPTLNRYPEPEYRRDLDRMARGRMYFTEPMTQPIEVDNPRDGRSHISRRGYMEAKEMGKDSMREMEKYLQDLTSDLSEMIENMTQPERNKLKEKLATLVNKM